jgi:hypothetical protein
MKRFVIFITLLSVLLSISAPLHGSVKNTVEPSIVIPYCKNLPVIDGKIEESEWDFAAGISMLEAYPSYYPQVMRMEQAKFYVCWDEKNLYVAMDSLESPTNRIVARCVQNDKLKIIGDDCMEFMISPGDREAVKNPDFPTYYIAVNSIGTVWDSMFKPQRAETHNSWQSGAEIANSVDGTRWICEMRIPFNSISASTPVDGTVWRMNFDRTYYRYVWSAWNASGGLNDARVGGNVTFSKTAPAVRLVSVEDIIAAKLKILMEASNPSEEKQDVTLKMTAEGFDEKGQEPARIAADEKTVSLMPGERKEIFMGKGEQLHRYNTVAVTAADRDGKNLFFLRRDVQIPVPRIAVSPAPELPLVYVFPRFLPSMDRLAVQIDATAWLKRAGVEDGSFSADIKVYPKDSPEKIVLQGECGSFEKGKAVARYSTKDLPEGEYIVEVRVSEKGRELAVHNDWFEKRIFDWMVDKRGIPDEVPAPYTPLKVEGTGIKPWGRNYIFGVNGLPQAIISQEKKLLSGPVTIEAVVNGRRVQQKVVKPFRVETAKQTEVSGKSHLLLDNLSVTTDSTTEFDGLTIFRLTYAPVKGTVSLNRMRLRIPLTGRYCRFYSASGDKEGTSIMGEVIPEKQGMFYNSKDNTYAVGGYPTFATLLWLGDYDSYFCYAADNPKGWVLRDESPAVEAYREGNEVVVWLNLVDRQITLSEPATLEFAFQTGPVKPLPEGWRGVQFTGDPKAAPVTISMVPGAGGGFTLFGGPNFIHPGLTPEMVQKSKERIEKHAVSGPYKVVGYHRWPMFVKGHPAARVFRGEWGIDKTDWETTGSFSRWQWEQKLFGNDKDMHIRYLANPVPSYVDYMIYSYEEALKNTELCGTYDDTGSPISIYDEELGLGYTAEDGRKVSSSGLWVYRDRWKRAAVLHAKYNRPNYTMDSQHTIAHYQPAYGFIGMWVPCERGFYNHHPDRDNLDFYGSIERYYAYNPSHAFGQMGCAIGMGSPQKSLDLQLRDTRVMMMLALLHDQDVGTFGHRDMPTVYRIREARNVFRQWEKDVSFTGHWEEDNPVRAGNKNFKISLYRRKGSALFIIGNTGEEDSSVIIPDWKTLNINLKTAQLGDTETGEKIPLKDTSFTVKLPRHGLQIVLAGDLSGYNWQPEIPGRSLPKPISIIPELSDTLNGPKLGAPWTVELQKGSGSTGFVNNMCYLQKSLYGYSHIRRKIGIDNVSVQCTILKKEGGNDLYASGLALWWNNGSYVRIIPGGQRKKFQYEVSGNRTVYGQGINTTPAPRLYPYFANGVRIQLSPDAVRFFVSTDGRTWVQDKEIKRTAELRGAPEWAILGSGAAAGDNPLFKNIHSKHFNPDYWSHISFFTGFVVGKE